MDTAYFASHIQCSHEEKLQCMDIVNQLLYLSDISRKYGLLALEKEITSQLDDYPYSFLKFAASLVAEGTDPIILREILENFIISSSLNGCEFLKYILILNGIIAIQAGENPRYIKDRLCSFFGFQFYNDFQANCHIIIKQTMDEIAEDVKKILDKHSKLPHLESFLELDSNSLQRILHECDNQLVFVSLLGASYQTAMHFLKQISFRLANFIVEDMSRFTGSDDEIEKMQRQMVSIMEHLALQGEIILPDNFAVHS